MLIDSEEGRVRNFTAKNLTETELFVLTEQVINLYNFF
jgi:hypothetical protein